ncbi:MAG: hypothetical protein HIU84_14030 [Acidobacteria bacterium]|nr:hypothetical protein [Acidobacteriota bacterium]
MYTIFLFKQALSVPPAIWQDSTAYAAVASSSLFRATFWAGARPPFVPLVMRMVGSGGGFVILETAVAAIAWGLLMVAVGLHVRKGISRVIAAVMVLGIASSNPVALWNGSVLSESLAISTLVLMVSALLWAAKGVTPTRIVLVCGSALCFATTRDSDIATVAFIALGCSVPSFAHRRANLHQSSQWALLSVVLLSVVLATGAGVVVSGRGATNVADVYSVRIFPFPNRVAWFAAHGMPQATAIDQLASTTPPSSSDTAKTLFVLGTNKFVHLNQWFESRGESTYLLYLLTHPGYDFTAPLVRPELSFNFAHGNLYFYEARGWTNFPGSEFFWPPLPGLIVIAALTAAMTTWRRSWRNLPWRVAVMICVVGVLTMYVAWHGDGQETTRHTIEGFVEVRLGLWIALALGTLGQSNT